MHHSDKNYNCKHSVRKLKCNPITPPRIVYGLSTHDSDARSGDALEGGFRHDFLHHRCEHNLLGLFRAGRLQLGHETLNEFQRALCKYTRITRLYWDMHASHDITEKVSVVSKVQNDLVTSQSIYVL